MKMLEQKAGMHVERRLVSREYVLKNNTRRKKKGMVSFKFDPAPVEVGIGELGQRRATPIMQRCRTGELFQKK
jgi:hypothetical protein